MSSLFTMSESQGIQDSRRMCPSCAGHLTTQPLGGVGMGVLEVGKVELGEERLVLGSWPV